MSKLPHCTLFADGASSGNPGPSGWGSIIVTPDAQIRELGGSAPSATNNQMELTAVIRAFREVSDQPGPIHVYTDSTYVIRGITQWIWGWRKRGWKTAEGNPVANEENWKELSKILAARREKSFLPPEWRYVRGHSNVPGNERVDEIAVAFSKGKRPALYHGPLLNYSVALFDLPESFELPELKPIQSKEKEVPYSYLSLINGKVERHGTWIECEARVKGRPGAKFKKAMSPAQESEILAAWGVQAPKS